MAIAIRASESNPGVPVVVLSGRLDMETAEADYPVVRRAVEESGAGVLIDLSGVEFIGSSGFRMLLRAHQQAQAAGKPLALTRPRPAVYKIFKVAAMDERFSFFDDEAVAVEALCG